ncbi:zinc-ribbon domain-containing protein [Sulfolobus sp. E5-1-F]|uniref:zinc ribbon domain-containing protein n=1 Tax=Saccharolobus sp. E5-1-F TaxID=2663019 RepID=UPI001295E4BA|nr:zinc ribbon domain-containing protein [Sulfolobus sp. E5-1-F]QGA53211.1 zinc-ribbon domain-containing protein [Sulfolobus sp. E5-1-F]
MTKQCPKCGYVNPDDANYCSRCGYPLPQQPVISSNYPSTPPPNPLRPDRITASLNIFTRNLSIIFPSIIMLIIEIILIAVLGAITAGIGLILPVAFTVTAVIFSIIIGIIDAIIFSITVHTTTYMAQDAVMGTPLNLSTAFTKARNSLNRLYPIIAILVVLGILLGISRSVGLGWIIEGLVGVLLYIYSASAVLNKPTSLSETLNWYSRAFSADAGGAIVMLIGSLFSLIPVLNIFVIPYTSILTYLMVKDIS